MASHWKSIPSYWCKFCSSYVRDSPIERKNHETSIKHQNNIQRSLRELHKTKDREDRDKQRAKDEVARLNGIVGGGRKTSQQNGILGVKIVGSGGASTADPAAAAAQRKAHAEQLAAMGVGLPEELKKEITGVGEWQAVTMRVVDDGEAAPGMSMADILKQEQIKKEEDEKDARVKGVHKRRVDEEDVLGGEERSKKKAAWGGRLKMYPDSERVGDEQGDLDALLNGFSADKRSVENENGIDIEPKEKVALEGASEVKREDGDGLESDITAPPVPVFKKRRAKR